MTDETPNANADAETSGELANAIPDETFDEFSQQFDRAVESHDADVFEDLRFKLEAYTVDHEPADQLLSEWMAERCIEETEGDVEVSHDGDTFMLATDNFHGAFMIDRDGYHGISCGQGTWYHLEFDRYEIEADEPPASARDDIEEYIRQMEQDTPANHGSLTVGERNAGSRWL